MKARRVRRDEQMKLIMECRSSGLSDYQWCETQGIHPGTFSTGSVSYARPVLQFPIPRVSTWEPLFNRKLLK